MFATATAAKSVLAGIDPKEEQRNSSPYNFTYTVHVHIRQTLCVCVWQGECAGVCGGQTMCLCRILTPMDMPRDVIVNAKMWRRRGKVVLPAKFALVWLGSVRICWAAGPKASGPG